MIEHHAVNITKLINLHLKKSCTKSISYEKAKGRNVVSAEWQDVCQISHTSMECSS